jgi:hypothetical protein
MSASSRSSSVPRLALRVGEAAEAIGLSPDAFRDHLAPQLGWVRRGRLRIVSVRELEA